MIINGKIGWNLIKGYTCQKLKVKDLVAYSDSAGANVTEQYNTMTINSIKSETKERVESSLQDLASENQQNLSGVGKVLYNRHGL
jgi:hypothetical protein